MKQKGERSARPRFHILFLIDEITDANKYTALKQRVHDFFPYFDDKALDAARFFFGTADPKVSFHPGDTTLNAFMDKYDAACAETDAETAFEEFCNEADIIHEGGRNKAMHLIAVRLLKRYGDSEEARNAYLTESERCVPALDKKELRSIWDSAKRFYKETVVTSEGYMPPDVYNAPAVWETPIPFDEYKLPTFPVEALPPILRDYVRAVAETTQTSPDMAAAASLAVVAICAQGKFCISGKKDWAEPLNLFVVIIAPPAERKSAVMTLMTFPLEDYERKANDERSTAIYESEMLRSVLEREKKSIEDKVAKGKADREELKKKPRSLQLSRMSSHSSSLSMTLPQKSLPLYLRRTTAVQPSFLPRAVSLISSKVFTPLPSTSTLSSRGIRELCGYAPPITPTAKRLVLPRRFPNLR